MSIFEKLKNIPGIGTPSPESFSRQNTEDLPIKQAVNAIGYDIQARIGNELIKGWQSIANPLEIAPKPPKKEPEAPSQIQKLISDVVKAGFNKLLTKKTATNTQELSIISDIVEGEFSIMEEDRND